MRILTWCLMMSLLLKFWSIQLLLLKRFVIRFFISYQFSCLLMIGKKGFELIYFNPSKLRRSRRGMLLSIIIRVSSQTIEFQAKSRKVRFWRDDKLWKGLCPLNSPVQYSRKKHFNKINSWKEDEQNHF